MVGISNAELVADHVVALDVLGGRLTSVRTSCPSPS